MSWICIDSGWNHFCENDFTLGWDKLFVHACLHVVVSFDLFVRIGSLRVWKEVVGGRVFAKVNFSQKFELRWFVAPFLRFVGSWQWGPTANISMTSNVKNRTSDMQESRHMKAPRFKMIQQRDTQIQELGNAHILVAPLSRGRRMRV